MLRSGKVRNTPDLVNYRLVSPDLVALALDLALHRHTRNLPSTCKNRSGQARSLSQVRSGSKLECATTKCEQLGACHQGCVPLAITPPWQDHVFRGCVIGRKLRSWMALSCLNGQSSLTEACRRTYMPWKRVPAPYKLTAACMRVA